MSAFALWPRHEHDEGEVTAAPDGSPEPWDPVLFLHIFVMTVVYAFIFPVGFLLARKRSPWHGTFQVFGSVLALIGYVLGHKQKNQFYPHNPHSYFQIPLLWMLLAQGVFGLFLKYTKSWRRPCFARIRRYIRIAHLLNGWSFLLLPYAQGILGLIAVTKTCGDDEVGNCAAHFIMGSFFVYYGAVSALRHFGSLKTRRPVELYDSVIILLWGIIQTSSEHRWGSRWNHTDMQHISSGILWTFGGAVSLLLSVFRPYRKRARNVVPGLIIAFTGIVMSNHTQHTGHGGFSVTLHGFFGCSLVICGLLRILNLHIGRAGGLNLIAGFFFILSGCLLMGGNSTAVALAEGAQIDPVSYCTVLAAIAFMILLYVLCMLLVARHGVPGAWDRDGDVGELPIAGCNAAGYASLAALAEPADYREDDEVDRRTLF
ncbi:hypothetical protein BDK51DRAFT_16100 [Blyttiomyces helicus]|uniref:Cytochrome b561 domain-containing protein n=1 Tax=Blyttiomyces helicus TaxID=388810 RepID=A0A4P9WEJ2_9FUNG|nr:hypothetical protein BDK51DRAFT_16100 [Blyttiomyces helicus]|eukprot:RKO91014.1 hypothetical protein BDK51DRAFT_16100 [Blyttiomyces helicus]